MVVVWLSAHAECACSVPTPRGDNAIAQRQTKNPWTHSHLYLTCAYVKVSDEFSNPFLLTQNSPGVAPRAASARFSVELHVRSTASPGRRNVTMSSEFVSESWEWHEPTARTDRTGTVKLSSGPGKGGGSPCTWDRTAVQDVKKQRTARKIGRKRSFSLILQKSTRNENDSAIVRFFLPSFSKKLSSGRRPKGLVDDIKYLARPSCWHPHKCASRGRHSTKIRILPSPNDVGVSMLKWAPLSTEEAVWSSATSGLRKIHDSAWDTELSISLSACKAFVKMHLQVHRCCRKETSRGNAIQRWDWLGFEHFSTRELWTWFFRFVFGWVFRFPSCSCGDGKGYNMPACA